MPKKGRFYLIQYPYNVRFRNTIVKKGKKIEPMIQIEVKMEDKWSPVIRADKSLHEFLHLDFFNRDGKKIRQTALNTQEPIEAIVEAIDFLKKKWKKTFSDANYPELIKKFGENKDFLYNELEAAKKYLVEQAQCPEKIVDLCGKGVKPFTIDSVLVKEDQTNNKKTIEKD